MALIFQKAVGLDTWVICLIAGVLMVVTGVLSQDEAVAAMPTWMYLLFVGSLAMGGALTNTGAGQIIGDAVAAAADTMNNPFLIYLMFFLIPFLMTQVMQNRGVMLIFIPIAIQACKSMGANPVGVIICVQAACLTAFMTPMATAAVPYYMAAGGYDLKSVVKQSILPAILFCAVSVVWSAIALPPVLSFPAAGSFSTWLPSYRLIVFNPLFSDSCILRHFSFFRPNDPSLGRIFISFHII